MRTCERRAITEDVHVAFEPPIVTTVTVVRPLSEVTYLVRLPNGKEITGHLSRALRQDSPPPRFATNDRLEAEMTPYDFSKARLVRRL